MLRIVQVGLGPLGRQVVRFAAERSHLKVVAAVDPAADLVGRDVGSLCGLPALGVPVAAVLKDTAEAGAQLAVLTTFSDLERVEAQLNALADARLSVVSTCEELSYPWAAHPEAAARIDGRFRERGVACLGTGVNPGFLMDFLPAVLSGLSRRVDSVVVRRVQDASARRIPFQKKIGTGLTIDEFAVLVAEGSLRHVGLPESAQLLAVALGLHLDDLVEELLPVIATRRIDSGYRPVERGMACGVEQIAVGLADGEEVLRLEFRAAVGERDARDEVLLEGEPRVHMLIPGGVNGDVATCAVVLNALPAVATASPGLHTMLSVPIPSVGREA